VVIGCAICAAIPLTVRAQVSGTWTGAQDGTWNVAANWTSNPLVPGNGGTAHFDQIAGQFRGPWLVVKSPVNIGRLEFGEIVNTAAITSDANMLKLVGPAEVYTQRSTVIGGASSDSNAGPLLIGVGGAAGLNKRGPGSLSLQDNVYTGDTIVSEGNISLFNDAGLGAVGGRLVLEGGTLSGSPGISSLSVSHPIVIGTGGGSISELNRISVAAPVSGSGNLRITTQDFVSAVFFEAQNTYTGSTSITGNVVLRASGSIVPTSQLTFTSGLISVDNRTASASVDRLGNNTPITIGAGTLEVLGSPTLSTVEDVGTISVSRFAGLRVASASSGMQTVLHAKALDRAPGSFVAFNFGSFAGQQVLIDHLRRWSVERVLRVLQRSASCHTRERTWSCALTTPSSGFARWRRTNM
jgi:hypothetical protein